MGSARGSSVSHGSLTLLPAIVLAFLLGTVPPLPVAGQAPEERIYELLESSSGFSLLGPVSLGALAAGPGTLLSVALIEGAEYMVAGYCDEECGNLDLTLFNPARQQIQADRLPDAEPFLSLTAEETGTHFIQVTVVDCAVEVCEFAVAVLGGTREPGVSPGEDMEGRLTLLEHDLRSMGFSRIGNDRRGALPTGETLTLPVPLQEGLEYRMTGVCDQDCWDLDLVLLDPSGEEVDSDLLEDDIPILAVVADTTADYQIQVVMVACDVEPCAFRIATHAKMESPSTGIPSLISFYETYRGELAPGDSLLEMDRISGHIQRRWTTFQDTYPVEVEPGQRIVADLRSDEFDTLLQLVAPSGKKEESGELDSEIGHSHLDVMAMERGIFLIRATSYDSMAAGQYLLQIAVLR